ncbi:neutral zinc metallopeptidase [Microbacterium sp. NPDC091313]
MTFNDDAQARGSKARKRGAGVAIAGGGVVGVGALVVVLIQAFTGLDLTGLLGGAGGPAPESTTIANCDSGRDANESDECRLVYGSVALDEYWTSQLEGYRGPQLIVVDQSTPSACGTASNATGPFYCPPEETVYIDPTFFGLLREQYDATAGSLAQLYVLAHEYGHHVQNLTGVMDAHPSNGTGPDSNGVRTELQADCYAGAWVAGMTEATDDSGTPYLKAPTPAQIADALNAAASVGDDHIQQESGAVVNPDSWTHGSSEQRQRWFDTGYGGGPAACDTFAVAGAQL